MDRKKSVHDFAVERRSGKTLDKLTICSIAAEREGLSYGQYMVKYNYHPPCLEENPAESVPQAEMAEATTPGVKMAKCPECGEMFRVKANHQRYCSRTCQEKHNYRVKRGRYEPNHPKPERFCAVCGILLPKETRIHVVTCSPECRIERARELKRLGRERRKERMEGVQLRETSKEILPGNPEHRQAD